MQSSTDTEIRQIINDADMRLSKCENESCLLVKRLRELLGSLFTRKYRMDTQRENLNTYVHSVLCMNLIDKSEMRSRVDDEVGVLQQMYPAIQKQSLIEVALEKVLKRILLDSLRSLLI